jgi:hypothetical protein
MLKWIASLTASAALLAAGVVHGVMTDRWLPPADVARAAERLDDLPLEIGPWKGHKGEVKPGQAGAGVAGCIQRRYENARTGAGVVVALVCGRPGPVSIHTPEVCYGASGYLVGKRQSVPAGDTGGSLWRTDAVRTTATDEVRLRIYYGWHTAGGWVAPEDSRMAFPREKVLHKLYVVRELAAADEPKDEPCEEFLRLLLPELERTALSAAP